MTPRTQPLRIAAGLLALFCLTCLPGCGLMDAVNLGGSTLAVLLGPGLLLIPIGMAARNYFDFRDDFAGARVYSTTQANGSGHAYTITDTSAAGTPTYVSVDGSESGEFAATFDATSEVQNVCLSQGDKLQYDIDRIVEAYFRVKMNAGALDSATSFAIGITGDRNDAIDSIAQAALFRIIGSNAIVVETDDGTTDLDDKATGKTLVDSFVDLVISFACGKADVRFFVNGQPVATDVTFDMSAYSGALQLFAQIQKTADTNTDGFVLDDWGVRGRKTLIAA